jgi:hypothetical protein
MPDVRTAEALAKSFEARSVAAEVITGQTNSTDRKSAYERFNNGVTQVLVSCMVLTEGFDAPLTSCVIIGRPTLNPGLYIQMVGRGLRLYDGKTDCLVLDIAGASNKHSLAGVNDLESDCESTCDCNCLTCGCSDRCKCGIQKCGCTCTEQHEGPSKACWCAGDAANCGCGCEGDPYGTGDVHCICAESEDCQCRGEGPVLEDKEVDADVLRNLVDVDILGAELAQSHYTWLATNAGINFLSVGTDAAVFLLPDPNSDGYFQGLVTGIGRTNDVTRLDSGALTAAETRSALEAYADSTGYTYTSRKATWRRGAASEAQKGLLRRLGATVPEGCTKGAASDLLSVTRTSGAIDPRFGHYAAK